MSVTLRQWAAFSVLAFFCFYFFSAGIFNPSDLAHSLTARPRAQLSLDFCSCNLSILDTPDLSRYTPPRTLSEDEFPIRSSAFVVLFAR
jgi:hypothetical protein